MNLEIIVATSNQGKVQEYRDLITKEGIVLYSLKDLNINVDVEETGKTFFENAVIKAQAIAKLTNKLVIADDSGLEIDELDGFPGIYSARFAKEMGSYPKAYEYIFDKLKDKSSRGAQFHCVIALCNATSQTLTFEGVCRGEIGYKAEGSNGFGYDPIFICEETKKSFGITPEEEKNKLSHRAKACKKLLAYLSIAELI